MIADGNAIGGKKVAKVCKKLLPGWVCSVLVVLVLSSAHAQTDPLPSWNDTGPKKAIVAFVWKVTAQGTPDFVPIDQRIARSLQRLAIIADQRDRHLGAGKAVGAELDARTRNIVELR